MTRSIIPFDFHSHVVRVVMRDGNPWFVAKDVMDALDYAETSNPARVTEHIPSEWKGVNPIHTLGGEQKLLCLAEPGLYFFLGRSDKPKALPFQKWLAGEVLPSIRKTGSYVSNDTVSLTTVRRCGTVAAKEIKNSGNSGNRTRNPCGFFTPARFYVGRAAAIQHPAKGKAARRLFPVFDLPTPTGAARKNVSPWSSHETGDVL
ncbi:BRO-N domain-containing protein [Xylella fastidiosa]|uniref:Bro-N domain-containing protein n=1 Tax=Xylella fastidiosa subsp. sandyi Ann-1 TaxID=155920 RepID=A0A060HDA6_XYLFS|nr:BRO family protein [Xylella fastidiosa]AIC11366.1 hypothetical protein D934_08450 [Xylella fastidiosa subsp. sandyi Ann-1]UIX82152.1 hypothetical protein LZ756_04665 [Xylella fastidiosa subsp. sandyi]